MSDSRRESEDKIYFKFDGVSVGASHGQSVLDAILACNLPINYSCGGNGTCGTCRVLVQEGTSNLPKPEGLEAEMAQERSFSSNERLSCQIVAVSGLVLCQPKPTI